LLGADYDDGDLVFAHSDGRPLHPERVSRWFSKLVGTTDAPPIRLHDLRHLHATLALAAGVAPRVVADRLGHSTTAVTTDTYQHVLPDLNHDAARRVAALVFADPGRRGTGQGSA
jgi:integrase